MDVFLILYVLGLLVLFFFLGTAIGGVAHSFKSFMTGRKQTDGLAEAAVAGAAIAGTAVISDNIASDAREPEAVRVTSDELVINPAEEWVEQPGEPDDQVDLAADISRDETKTEADNEIYEQSQPLTDSELPPAEEFSNAEVYRDEDEAAPASEVNDTVPQIEEPVEVAIEPSETVEQVGISEHAETVEETAPTVTVEQSAEDSSQAEPEVVAEEILAAVNVATSESEQRYKKSEAVEPLVWDYTKTSEDYSDIVFITEGENDDLTKVRGITTEIAASLNELGLRRYDQIAALTGRQVEYLKSKLGFTSQINEEVWIEQAKILASGGTTAFAASQMEEAAVEVEPESAIEPEPEIIEQIVDEEITEQVAHEDTVQQDAPPEEEPEILEVDVEEAEVIAADDDVQTEDGSEPSLAAIAAAGLTAQAASEIFTEEQQEEQPDEDASVEEFQSEDDAAVAEVEIHRDQQPENENHDTREAERRERKRREEHRLFGEKERLQRDEEWRNRYQRERVIQPRDKSGNHDEAGQVVSETAMPEAESEAPSVIEANLAAVENQIDEPEQHAEPVDERPEPEDVSEPELVAITEEIEPQLEGRPVDSDDLKQIEFISTGLEKKLNLLGVYKLSQIANWTPETITEISEQLEFRGDKIINEDWIAHAQRALDLKQETKTQDKGGLFSASDLIARLEQLDKITDLTEHEKTLLSNNGITELSQIANWSGADVNWAKGLLEVDNVERVEGWVEAASALISSGKNDIPGGAATGPSKDLKRIRGVDQDAEALLNGIGVNTYSQIAEWQQKEMDRINDLLGTSGRVEREYWVVQAKVLKDGGATDFSKLYDEK